MSFFVERIQDPTKGIDAALSTARQKMVENNRRLLLPVVQTVLLCGRNMLPLRGHRDDGPLNLDVPCQPGEGVFRALLRYRTQGGDSSLRQLVTEAGRNCTMISKTTQEEVIDITGKLPHSRFQLVCNA